MADKEISALTAASALADADLLHVSQGGNSRKATMAQVKAAVLTPRGARVRMTSDDAAQNITTEAAISFDVADYDSDSFWSAGAPTKLTIPAGVTHVMLTGQVNISSSTADSGFQVSIIHYNAANTPLHHFRQAFLEQSTTGRCVNVSTGLLPVDATDYLTLNAREETDASVTIEGDQTVETYLSLVVLGQT